MHTHKQKQKTKKAAGNWFYLSYGFIGIYYLVYWCFQHLFKWAAVLRQHVMKLLSKITFVSFNPSWKFLSLLTIHLKIKCSCFPCNSVSPFQLDFCAADFFQTLYRSICSAWTVICTLLNPRKMILQNFICAEYKLRKSENTTRREKVKRRSFHSKKKKKNVHWCTLI